MYLLAWETPRGRGRLRSPHALEIFPEIFGQAAGPVLAAALAPDAEGWQVVTLSFEHELAAAWRLAGFGGLVQVLSPLSVRDELLRRGRDILARYDAGGRTGGRCGRCRSILAMAR